LENKYILQHFLLLGILLLVFSCDTTKSTSTDDAVISEFLVGNYNYHFTQTPKVTGCNYDQMGRDQLVQFLELNSEGDRDDRVPRKLLSFDESVLSKKRTDNKPVQVKVCMNKSGAIVAYRHIQDDNHLDSAVIKAIKKLVFEASDESSCIECKDLYLWTVK